MDTEVLLSVCGRPAGPSAHVRRRPPGYQAVYVVIRGCEIALLSRMHRQRRLAARVGVAAARWTAIEVLSSTPVAPRVCLVMLLMWQTMNTVRESQGRGQIGSRRRGRGSARYPRNYTSVLPPRWAGESPSRPARAPSGRFGEGNDCSNPPRFHRGAHSQLLDTARSNTVRITHHHNVTCAWRRGLWITVK